MIFSSVQLILATWTTLHSDGVDGMDDVGIFINN